jgi:hypothetical protein
MGASDAYGGSAGWNDTRDDTNDWIDSRPESGGGEGPGGDGTGDEPPGGDVPPIPGDEPPSPSSPEGLDPGIARILAGIAGRLAATIATTTSPSGRARGGGREAGGGTRGGGGGGARGRAATSGGVAIAGAYGLRSGDADAVGDAGLSLADLGGLSPFQQAQRLVDAASGQSALIEQDEIREVNANFMWWSIEQEQPPSPAELVKAWVTEFVYRTWLTEAGSVLRDGTRDGAATHALEREVRVTLEAAVSRVDLPAQGLRAADFQEAISQLLGTLERIFSQAAA